MSARTYTGEHLRSIAFPLGGIGTGIVSLGGRGNLTGWEIMGRPAKGFDLPYTFFAIQAQPEGEAPHARVLERKLFPPFTYPQGLLPIGVPGLPRFDEVTFQGTYPNATLDFSDPKFPVTVSLAAWNPLVPGDTEASGLPLAAFDWTVINPTEKPVSVTIALSLYNPIGLTSTERFGPFNPGRFHSALGKNVNTWNDTGMLRGITFSSEKRPGEELALATPWQDTAFFLHWERAGWWDDIQSFWDAFRQGRLPSDPTSEPSPEGQTDVGTLALKVTLAPGTSATLPFVLAWRFPHVVNHWNGEEAVKGKPVGQYYATRFSSAWEVAAHFQTNRSQLETQTQAYISALYGSTLPEPVLDAVAANVSILRSPTVMRTADGRMNGFEGCNPQTGCCPMNCTHVWNYAQTVAYLFPELERTVRETDFAHNTRPSGEQAFRTLLPLTQDTFWDFVPAADGQLGTILKAYREWLNCGDLAWLKRLWPQIQKSLEFAWSPENRHGWDADKDGVLEGIQHNTYDIEFTGPNTMAGTLYLAALRACAALAAAVGEPEKAAEYTALAQRGAEGYGKLFNGEYFEQEVRFNVETQAERLTRINNGVPLDGTMPRYQHGPGCLSDHLLGQWFAQVVGLGNVLDGQQVKSALRAIYRHNFKHDLSDHESVQRVYALSDEAGLLLCTWPHGGRPAYPFPYADEVWTGIEYQVAAHCLYEGLLDEGLAMVEAVRARHDGLRRNPWDEFECGHHYARAMASWSLLLALSGQHYSAPTQSLSFTPRLPVPFRCFFTAGEAWGTYEQTEDTTTLSVLHGTLELKQLNQRPVQLALRAGESVHL